MIIGSIRRKEAYAGAMKDTRVAITNPNPPITHNAPMILGRYPDRQIKYPRMIEPVP
jgi:hypothetical protein